MTSSSAGGVTTSYTYAGADQNKVLTEATAGGTSYSYTYGRDDAQGVPTIVKQSISGGATSEVLSDPRTGQALGLRTGAGSTGMYLTNGIGNQVGMLTDSGTVAFRVAYAPYGAQTVTAGDTSDHWKQNPFGFKSGNGTYNGALVKFGVRWYLATTGTWTQRDTLDAPLDPKNANRYAYASNDPINRFDPTGQVSDCAIALGSLAVAEFGLVLSAASSNPLVFGVALAGLAYGGIGVARSC